MRFQHENSLRAMRAKFLQERRQFEEEHETRTAAMTSLATQVRMHDTILTAVTLPLLLQLQQADVCVKQHSRQIMDENKQLRVELHELIEATQGLQAQKKRLERQHQALLREKELQEDLKKLRLRRAGLAT